MAQIKEQFEIGDVVKLKSGGPSMTVEEIKESNIKCTWFREIGKVDEATFSEHSLVKNKTGGIK